MRLSAKTRQGLTASSPDQKNITKSAGFNALRIHARRPYNSFSLRRGLRTSSPPQFGQIASIAAAHAAQNVHSKLQM